MRREFERLGDRGFDLLIVGGGAYGAWSAYDASLRGLRVALVEKDDWAAGTSSASSKLVHGGLRYLERLELRLVRKTLGERRLLVKLGPHRVHPLRFVLPVYDGDPNGRLKLRLGLWLYDRLAGSRQPVAPHASLSKAQIAERCPFLSTSGLCGGLTYGDCGMDDARFALEIVDGAVRSGAVAVNRATASRLLVEANRVRGAEVVDGETGRVVEVSAGATVACAGPWVGELVRGVASPKEPAVRLTKGVHLMLPALPTDDAFLIASPEDRRIVFFIPWYGRTIVGTTDTDYAGDPDRVGVAWGDVDYLLGVANRVLDTAWGRDDVIAAFAGLRTLIGSAENAPSSVSREWLLDSPLPGLWVPVGGKWTSARADAAETVDRVLGASRARSARSRTADLPLPWCPPEPIEAWQEERLARSRLLGLAPVTGVTMLSRHGSRIDGLLDRIAADPELASPVVAGAPFCRAELVHAVEEEMARGLEDLLRRRVPLALVCPLDPRVVEEAAGLLASALDWSPERRREEVASWKHGRRYGMPTPD